MVALACMFCQRIAPDVKITREHVIPQWIDDVLTTSLVGADISSERIVRGPGGAGAKSSWKPKQLAGAEIRGVCDQCNSGWMATSDAAAEALLKSMVLGYNATLTTEEQFTVASWATLKAMVLDFGWDKDQPPVFSQEDRTFLMTQQHPPASVQIRAAAVESVGVPVSVRRLVYVRATTAGTAVPAPADLSVCVTLAFGCFVVQVFGGPAAGDGGLREKPVTSSGHLSIYPPVSANVRWPPAETLTDSTLESFGNPFQR